MWQAVRAEPAETAPAETAPGETNPAETAAEARNERELERARQVARTVLDYVRTLDGVPSPDQFLFEGAAQFRTWSPESESPAPDYDWERFVEHRTGAQIDALLHYGHSNPMSRGLTKEHVDEHFPGWTWGTLLDVLKAADVFIGRGGAPPRCRPTVKAIHFTDPRRWAVEWLDGTVTASGQ